MQQIQMPVLIIILSGLCVSCSNETKISFSQQVMPILKESCFPCHQAGGVGELASGLNVENYQNLMKGTKIGPVIQPGQSFASTLQVLVDHKADGAISMPKGGNKLSKEKIEIIGKWIDQGAKNN